MHPGTVFILDENTRRITVKGVFDTSQSFSGDTYHLDVDALDYHGKKIFHAHWDIGNLYAGQPLPVEKMAEADASKHAGFTLENQF